MLATEYAKYYGVEPQQEGDSDLSFRSRVSGVLRDMGHIIEAHEAYQDKRFDESSDVIDGIAGAMAQALYGVDYGSRGEQQVGNDIAAGAVVKAPPRHDNGMAALLSILLFDR